MYSLWFKQVIPFLLLCYQFLKTFRNNYHPPTCFYEWLFEYCSSFTAACTIQHMNESKDQEVMFIVTVAKIGKLLFVFSKIIIWMVCCLLKDLPILSSTKSSYWFLSIFSIFLPYVSGCFALWELCHVFPPLMLLEETLMQLHNSRQGS